MSEPKPTERAAAAGAEYISTPDFEGVIFSDFDCVPGYSLCPCWVPTRELVLRVEARLPEFLRVNPLFPGEMEVAWHRRYGAPLILARLSEYRRQYWGIVFNDEPTLYVNCFLGDGWGDWMAHPIDVCDGGHYYFQLVYHPERDEFVAFWVNGEA